MHDHLERAQHYKTQLFKHRARIAAFGSGAVFLSIFLVLAMLQGLLVLRYGHPGHVTPWWLFITGTLFVSVICMFAWFAKKLFTGLGDATQMAASYKEMIVDMQDATKIQGGSLSMSVSSGLEGGLGVAEHVACQEDERVVLDITENAHHEERVSSSSQS